jgi:hypothetical protein
MDADGIRGLLGRVSGLLEGHDVDGHAPLGGRLTDALEGGVGWLRHGASLASGLGGPGCTIGSDNHR